MQTAPLISLIIPAHNAEGFLAECLESILSQTYQSIEIIVVDDGSTDKTAEIAHKYQPRIRYFHQNASGGPATPRNVGLAHSHGDYLCFFDSDDLMVQGCLSKQVDFLERHPDAGMVFCNYINFAKDKFYRTPHFQSCPEFWHTLSNKEEMILQTPCRVLAKENFGIMGTLMIRRSMLKYEKGFNENLTASVDFYFYYKLARFTQVGINNYVGQLRRLHEGNITNAHNKSTVLNMGIYSYRLLCETEQDKEAKILLNKCISTWCSERARFNANHGDYLQSFQDEWRALFNDFCFDRLSKSLKSFARTALMAVGIHNPQDEVYRG